MFISTQGSQAATAQNYELGIVRTPYHNVLAHRTSELYSTVADEDGVVTEVTDTHFSIKYKSGGVKSVLLGLNIGEASGEYHRHTTVTDIKKGQKFEKGEVLAWDDSWFKRDPYVKGQVAWTPGANVMVALMEEQSTYEDSLAMSMELAEKFVTPYIVPSRFQIDTGHHLNWKVKIGDEIEYDSILCEIDLSHNAVEDSNDTFIGSVNRLGVRPIRSKHHGKIVDIDVLYNLGDETLLSPSVKTLIKAADKRRSAKAELIGSDITNNSVRDSSSVSRPMLAPGRVLITVYVESLDPTTTSDKFVICNQLKNTVGVIMDKPMMTKSGLQVDIKTAYKGPFNRMVLSLRDQLIAATVARGITKVACKLYRGK